MMHYPVVDQCCIIISLQNNGCLFARTKKQKQKKRQTTKNNDTVLAKIMYRQPIYMDKPKQNLCRSTRNCLLSVRRPFIFPLFTLLHAMLALPNVVDSFY